MQTSQKTPQISVVIPCYKQPVELNNCLLALRDQKCTLDYEIIVVDSEPSENIGDVVNRFAEVMHVRGEENLKPGPARNLGVENSRSDYIAFLDSDCIPDEHWLQHAYESLEQGYKLVGGPIVDQLPNNPVSSIDNLLQFVDYSDKRPDGMVNHVPAGNSAVTKEIFDIVGQFPEIDLIAGEDVLFSQKIIQKYPADIRFNNKMYVRHLGRKQFGEFLEHQKSFGYARGYYNLMLKDSYTNLLSYKIMILPVILKRFEYIMRKSVLYNPAALFRNLIFSPLIFAGLLYWAIGFQKGCEARKKIS